MVAINEIPMPECTSEGCSGKAGTCTDSRVHRNADNRAPATRNHCRTQPLVNNLYQGMALDAVTGLYYERERDYSPSLGRWMEQDPAQFINGANTYQFVNSSPVGNVDAEGEIWIGGDNLRPPSPVPPPAPKKCCPPFPALVKAWKRWVVNYLYAKAMYSALVSQQRFAHGIGNDLATATAELQHARHVIQLAQFDLGISELLGSTTDIALDPVFITANLRIKTLGAQYQGIAGDVASLEAMYARSAPTFAEVTNYINQLRKTGRAQGDYIFLEQGCG